MPTFKRINVKALSLALSLSSFFACGLQAAETPAETPEAVGSDSLFTAEQMKSRFIKDFQRWAKDDDGKLPRPDAVLAIGSSSMRMWRNIAQDLAPAEIIHRGFGGSTMKDVVAMQSFFERYACKKILIYQGDNDLLGKNKKVDADFLDPLKSFIAGIRGNHPDTEFYLISIKFSPSRMNSMTNYAKANEEMAEMARNDKGIHFIDVNSLMLDEDGQPRDELFLKDRLHMNEQGYAIWTNAVRPILLDGEK